MLVMNIMFGIYMDGVCARCDERTGLGHWVWDRNTVDALG